MSTRSLPVIAAHLVGIGFGLVSGYLLATPRPCPFPAGRRFGVGTQTFVDEPFVELLTARTRPDRREEWTLYVLNDVGFFLKKFSGEPIFPQQTGALYMLRDEPDRWNVDAEAQDFLRELITLGVVQNGGFWRTWDDVQRRMREVTP